MPSHFLEPNAPDVKREWYTKHQQAGPHGLELLDSFRIAFPPAAQEMVANRPGLKHLNWITDVDVLVA